MRESGTRSRRNRKKIPIFEEKYFKIVFGKTVEKKSGTADISIKEYGWKMGGMEDVDCRCSGNTEQTGWTAY